MPEKATIERAKRARRQGKSKSTAAGEFVREEMHHIREGKHGAKSAKQAIAIGLNKARRAGVDPGPKKRAAGKPTRRKSTKTKATQARATPRRAASKRPGAPSARRARAARTALKREPRRAASHLALSRQAHGAARRRTKASRSAAARKAARTRARAR